LGTALTNQNSFQEEVKIRLKSESFAFQFPIQKYNLPVVLYGCETWSQTEVRRLRAFENRVLRRIFGPKREEVTRGWRRLHKEEL